MRHNDGRPGRFFISTSLFLRFVVAGLVGSVGNIEITLLTTTGHGQYHAEDGRPGYSATGRTFERRVIQRY
ncbi:MAG: hypothetical protein FD130_2532 [Halothiobacillaceae bacterium]|nr:MAG: hypothetical protein FD130_2532 [Halothiobacillaceae bacterium]